MEVLPVLDLLDGRVVRGVAGERQQYRPVQSRLAPTADPATVARSFQQQLGLNRFYVADLNGILHGRPHWSDLQHLAQAGYDLVVDAGVRDRAACADLLDRGIAVVVVALELSPRIEFLQEVLADLGSDRFAFSLDLKWGRPLGRVPGVAARSPDELADAAVQTGFRRLIVLDLAGVGTGQGVATGELCARLRQRFPDLWLATGGGVRNPADLQMLRDIGLDAVLVASALHAQVIRRRDIGKVRRQPPASQNPPGLG